MANIQRNIEGHRKLEFKTTSDAGKAHQKVKRLIRKMSDEDGILVLTGKVLIFPSSINFNPVNATEI